MTETFIAISDGQVRGAVVCGTLKVTAKALADWHADPQVTEVVRVPVEVARRFLFEAWPGREAALAAVAAEAPDRTPTRPDAEARGG